MPLIPQSILSILIPAGYCAIIATGLFFANSAGSFSIAHAAIAGAGGYAAAIMTARYGYPLGIALVAAMVVGMAIGAIMAFLTRNMNSMTGGLSTLAFGQAMSVLAFNSSYLGGSRSYTGVSLLTNVWQEYAVLAVIIFLAWRFERSRIGFAALACREDPIAASAMGISVSRTKVLVFTIGAAIAGLGGGFRVHYIGVQNPSDLEFSASFNYLIFWIFGGSYSFWGPAFGAIVLTILPELLRFSISDRFIMYGALLVILIILRPKGLIPRTPLGSKPTGLKGYLEAIRRLIEGRTEGARQKDIDGKESSKGPS